MNNLQPSNQSDGKQTKRIPNIENFGGLYSLMQVFLNDLIQRSQSSDLDVLKDVEATCTFIFDRMRGYEAELSKIRSNCRRRMTSLQPTKAKKASEGSKVIVSQPPTILIKDENGREGIIVNGVFRYLAENPVHNNQDTVPETPALPVKIDDGSAVGYSGSDYSPS